MGDCERRSLCQPERADQARKFCRPGTTNGELAECFEVDRGTIDHWLRTEPAFAAGARRGRVDADAAVAERLFDRALGRSYEAARVMWPWSPLADRQSCSRGFNGKNGINSEKSLKVLKHNDLLGRINATSRVALIGFNGCNYLALRQSKGRSQRKVPRHRTSFTAPCQNPTAAPSRRLSDAPR